MSKLASALGRVMMGVSLSRKEDDSALRTWAEIEYKHDKQYAYQMLLAGQKPDIR